MVIKILQIDNFLILFLSGVCQISMNARNVLPVSVMVAPVRTLGEDMIASVKETLFI